MQGKSLSSEGAKQKNKLVLKMILDCYISNKNNF